MPTECERNSILLGAQKVHDRQNQHQHNQQQQQQQHSKHLETHQTNGMNDDNLENIESMATRSPSNDSMSQSQSSITSPTTETTTNGLKGSTNGGESKKTSLKSPDPTSYVTKARVTRPIPPPPSYNPMQFVQIKPCNLYQTAQEQLKKAEEVKKIKEIKKEEPEDWQNNLDNWKSSRRKRVEHIIDRVVEVKKLELEEHDRSRRKSKTFSEMIEERGERAGGRTRTKLTSLAVYNEDESNDLSDLGIGTSSASGKSSLSEDYDNNSVTSDNAELDKAIHNENNHHKSSSIQTREYIASPGYETSSSTAPASSPDPCEYTYEGAIQDYKQRISRATSSGNYKNIGSSNNHNNNSNMNGSGENHHVSSKVPPPNTLNLVNKEMSTESSAYSPRRGNKIEDRLLSFEVTSPSDHQDGVEKIKVDVPKIDISKRKEIFESQRANSEDKAQQSGMNGSIEGAGVAPKVMLRDRFKFESSASTESHVMKKEVKRLSGDVSSIRERLQSLEQQKEPSSSSLMSARSVDIPVPPLKDRLSSLQNAVKKEEIKKPPVALVDARQLEIMQKEEETAKQRMQQTNPKENVTLKDPKDEVVTLVCTSDSTELDDSGIHTTDEAVENGVQQLMQHQQQQEQQLNAAIAALAMEEQQLEQAANAVNQIEAEFDELSSSASASASGASNATNQTQLPYEMEFSINEALELALEAIDKETKLTANDAVEIVDNVELVDNVVLVESWKSRETKSQNKIEIETTNQTNKTKRINQNNTEKKRFQPVEEEEQVVETKHNQSQRQEHYRQEVATYVPQETHATTTMTTTTEAKNQNQKEPIYENISSASSLSSSPRTSSSLSPSKTTLATTMQEKVVAEFIADSVIIPNGAKSCIDNNNDSNKLQQNYHAHHHHHHHNHQTNKHHAQQQQQHPQQPLHHNKINSSSNQTNQNNYESNNNNHNNNNNNKSIDITTTKAILTTPSTTKTTTTLFMTMEQQNEARNSPHAIKQSNQQKDTFNPVATDAEPYYQVPKSSEPYYDAPKHLRPVPVYENIEIFYNGLESSTLSGIPLAVGFALEPPKEKPPPPPAESPPPIHDTDESINDNTDNWSSSDNTYETISTRHSHRSTAPAAGDLPSPPIKRINSTKRIKKELRNKRSSFLGIDASALDDEDHYLEMTVAPPPDMAQFLQQERQLEKQLYMKAAGLCDSSDTGESRDSGVSENHSRQSSEHYTNSSEENERHIDVGVDVDVDIGVEVEVGTTLYHHNGSTTTIAAQTPLLQTVKGDSAESWTESATAAAAASQSLTEATATANAKMLSIEEKIREQEEVLRVERELLQLEQEELKRQRENLMLRENMARRELQHGAKMLMSANRRSLQELNGNAAAANVLTTVPALSQLPITQAQTQPQQQQQQQIYANVPNLQQQYYQMDIDYRKSMSDLNEFSSKRGSLPPTPPTKPMRAMHIPNGRQHADEYVVMTAQQRFGGSLVKIAAPAPTAAPRSHTYSNFQHRSQQNLCANAATSNGQQQQPYHGNMTRNTLHALSATPKPKYTDGWVQQQQQQHQQQHQQNRKSIDATATPHLLNDPAWLSAYQQKRKSMPDAGSAFSAYNGNHWLVQEAEQRRITEQQQRSLSNGSTPLHQKSNGKPLPDAIIQTLTERVQSKGIGERKRLDNFKNTERSPLHAAAAYQQNHYSTQHHDAYSTQPSPAATQTTSSTPTSDKVLSVSGKKKCSHCGDELGRGAAMIIESLLLFYHINCFKCCVCHVQLGDGLNGTDVRVRNHKLHCQNCYSSDDGIKFSCV